MRLNIDVELDYHFPQAADVLLAVEVAQLPDQRLIEDLLTVDGAGPLRPIAGEDGIGRRTWLRRAGAVPRPLPRDARRRPPRRGDRRAADRAGARSAGRGRPLSLAEPLLRGGPVRGLRRAPLRRARGRRQGARHGRLDPRPRSTMSAGSSDATTTAVDAFVSRQGVCRDYRPSDGELRPRRRHPGAAGLGLCLAARSARFPRRGRGLARRRLAPGRRHRPRADRGPRPHLRRPRRHRHRLHDHLRRSGDAQPEREGDARSTTRSGARRRRAVAGQTCSRYWPRPSTCASTASRPRRAEAGDVLESGSSGSRRSAAPRRPPRCLRAAPGRLRRIANHRRRAFA